MPIPKPSETKQPILNYLTKAGRPVRKAAVTEAIGQHFNLTKKEMEETSLKGSKRFAMCINASMKEMKAAGLIRSHRHGFLEITPKGRGGLAGSITQAGTATNGRRRLGRPPKLQVKAPINERRKPGRPPQVTQPTKQLLSATRLSTSRQPSVPQMKRDDKMVQMAADIVVSYVGKNTVPASQIPELIKSTYAALAGL